MSLRHHPGEELLMAYAAGSSGEALSLIVASHLGFCADCRRALAALEAAGGALLTDLPPVALAQDALEAVLARLGERPVKSPAKPVVKSTVPAPLRPYAGNDLATLPWRRIAPGIAYHPLFVRDGTRAQLIRVAAGHGVATHSHRGAEMTLVLEGGFTDETGQYGAGDFQTASHETVHAPQADQDGQCVILAVTEAPLVFSGLLPKLIGKLAGF